MTDIRQKALIAYKDAFAAACMASPTSTAFHSLLSPVYERFPRLKQYEKHYLQGFHDCNMDNLYRSRLVHGGFYNGQWFSTVSSRLDYYGHSIEPAMWSRLAEDTGHYWTDDKGKCNGSRPFFVGR